MIDCGCGPEATIMEQRTCSGVRFFCKNCGTELNNKRVIDEVSEEMDVEDEVQEETEEQVDDEDDETPKIPPVVMERSGV